MVALDPEASELGARWSYSTHGEDRLALQTLAWYGLESEHPFYVDVGAFHPTVASNTALLHRLGWDGINVEPNPAMAERFREERPMAATVQAAIGVEPGEAELLFFYEWASSNTLVQSFADAVAATQDAEVSQRVPVRIVPLATIIEEHLPAGRDITFMTIDVEGMEMEVLRSNDWERFRPRLLAVEDIPLDLRTPGDSPVYEFLVAREYRLVCHALLTSFYVDERAATPQAFTTARDAGGGAVGPAA